MRAFFVTWVNTFLCLKSLGGCNDGWVGWKIRNALADEIDLVYSGSRIIENIYNIVQTKENDTIEINCRPKATCGKWELISAMRNGASYKPIEFKSPYSGRLTVLIGCTKGEYDIVLKGNYTPSEYHVHFSVHPVNYVGIEESNANINFLEVYPNPSSNEISIANASQQIKEVLIYNSSGNVVMQNLVNDNGIKFNIEALPKGLYYLTAILEDRKRVTKKIIVQ